MSEWDRVRDAPPPRQAPGIDALRVVCDSSPLATSARRWPFAIRRPSATRNPPPLPRNLSPTPTGMC